jgi:hypothetical protein
MWHALCLAMVATAKTDVDGDGLDDDFEMQCAQQFKPVVYLAEGEQFNPTMVDEYLSGCTLRRYGSCGHSDDVDVKPVERKFSEVGLCPWATAVAYRYAACGFTDPDTTLGPVNESTLTSAASAGCGGSGGCYIRCLRCQEGEGKCNNLGMSQPGAAGAHGAALADVPFYVHAFPDVGGSVQIQYWCECWPCPLCQAAPPCWLPAPRDGCRLPALHHADTPRCVSTGSSTTSTGRPPALARTKAIGSTFPCAPTRTAARGSATCRSHTARRQRGPTRPSRRRVATRSSTRLSTRTPPTSPPARTPEARPSRTTTPPRARAGSHRTSSTAAREHAQRARAGRWRAQNGSTSQVSMQWLEPGTSIAMLISSCGPRVGRRVGVELGLRRLAQQRRVRQRTALAMGPANAESAVLGPPERRWVLSRGGSEV